MLKVCPNSQHSITSSSTVGQKRLLMLSSNATLKSKASNFINRVKPIFSPARLGIALGVFAFSHILERFLKGFTGLRNNHVDFAPNSEGASDSLTRDHNLLEVAINFTNLLISSLLAIGLDAFFMKGQRTFTLLFQQILSNESLKLAFSLSAFNSLFELVSHTLNQGHKVLFSVIASLVQLIGTFSLTRFISGNNSIASILAAACPCCSMPVCIIELFHLGRNFVKLLFPNSQAKLSTANAEQQAS
jgi:hypothetical protein